MVEYSSAQNCKVHFLFVIYILVDLTILRSFRDKRFQIVRQIWDVAAQEMGIPSVPRGCGDEGVIEWRAETTDAWNYFENLRQPGENYNHRITLIAQETYRRMIKPYADHSLLDLQERVTVEFEAWVILVLITTWKSPSSQHSEKNCWGHAWIRCCNLVETQRVNLGHAEE